MVDIVSHLIRPIGHVFYRNQRKYHIIGHLYDEAKNDKMFIYVAKYYGKHKQWWHYEAITAEEYDMDIEFGLIKEE